MLYGAETWTLRRNEKKQLDTFEMWVWRRMERVKWTDKIKNALVLERVGEGRIMLELIKWTDKIKNAVVLERVGEGRIMLELKRKRERNWLGHWLRRNCLLKDALEGMVNGKKVRGRRRCPMIDNIMINELYEDTKKEG